MKKFRNAILSVFFALCCVFTISSTNLSSVRVNAIENENQEEVIDEETYVYEDGVGKCELTLHKDFTFYAWAIMYETEELFEVNGTYRVENEYVVLIGENGEELKIKLNKDTMTFEEYIEEEVPSVEETPTYTDEEIEKVLNEAKDWIIALIVSFLGSGGLMAIAKAIINKWFSKKEKELELKVKQLEQDKVIATEQKDLIVSQFAELKQQFNEVLEHNVILCDYIKTKIEVDEEKEKRVNKLLEELLPKQEEGATDEK